MPVFNWLHHGAVVYVGKPGSSLNKMDEVCGKNEYLFIFTCKECFVCSGNVRHSKNIAKPKNLTTKYTAMKTLIVTLFLLFTWPENERGLLITEDRIMLVIDQNTTELELKEYKKKLASEYKINVDYKLKFNGSKKVKSVELSVDCNDGFKGNMKTLFMNENQKAGFTRDYSKQAATPFLIGSL